MDEPKDKRPKRPESGRQLQHILNFGILSTSRCQTIRQLPSFPLGNLEWIMSKSKTALKSFSLENNILEVSPNDEIYRFDADADKAINQEAPWKKEWVSQWFGRDDGLDHHQSSLLQVMQNIGGSVDKDGAG